MLYEQTEDIVRTKKTKKNHPTRQIHPYLYKISFKTGKAERTSV